MQTITRKQHIRCFTLVFSIKLLLFIFFAYQFVQNYPADQITERLFIIDGETISYYAPIESLAEGNGYSIKEAISSSNEFLIFPSTRRVPGIAVVYYPLLKIFEKDTARAMVVLVQFMVSTISVYLLGLLAFYLFQSIVAFGIVLLLYSLSSFVSIFDHYGISESFSISFLLIGFYFSFRAIQKLSIWNFFWAGIFLCWSTFIRPALGVSFPAIGLIFLIHFAKQKQVFSLAFLRSILLFALPLICCLSLWTARNHKVSGKIIPLEDNVHETQMFAYDARLLSIWDLIGAWGGQITRWSPNSMGEYFLSRQYISHQKAFSERMLNSQCNSDSIRSLQDNYIKSYDRSIPFEQRLVLAHRVVEQAYRFRKTFIKEKPFQYYVVSPIAMTGKFLYFKTVSYLPFPELAKMKMYHKAIKVFYILFFNVILAFAVLGAFFVFRNGSWQAKLFMLYPFFYTFVMIVIFIASEQRYVAPLYPIFVVYAGYGFAKILPQKISNKIQALF
jgi:hypothetical protein